MQKVMTVALALAVTAWASGALADAPAGATCAANLTPDGKAIYAVVAAASPTSETLKSVVEHETRSLAVAGKIGRGDARENAVAAGECMKARLQ
jgi:hypothetical protein